MNYKNVIYILTNPLYAGYIKIGYASDLKQRLASLNTGMLRNFDVFAVYETPVRNADKQLHYIIDDLAPIVRARVINGQKVQDKEFYKLEPEQAYDLLLHIAIMTGTENRLHKAVEVETSIASSCVQSISVPAEIYTIGEKTYPFVSWKETMVRHCEEIISLNGFDIFREKVLTLQVSTKKTKRKIFAETEAEMRGFSYYKFSEGELYLLTNYSASYIRKINAALNEIFPTIQIQYTEKMLSCNKK